MTPSPAFKINVFRTSVKPSWYAYQVIRYHDHALIAGGECRTKTSATKEAAARIRQIENGNGP
jgi:hypothetical protein